MTTDAGSAPPYRVSFTISVDDIVAYLRLLQRRLNLIGTALGLLVMSIGGIVALAIQDAFTGVWTFGIGLLFVVLANSERLDRWRVRRSARSLIGSNSSFVFDDEGIKADTITGRGRVPWSDVTEMIQSDRVLVVKRDRVPVVWIPKRAFASEKDQSEIVDFITRSIARTR